MSTDIKPETIFLESHPTSQGGTLESGAEWITGFQLGEAAEVAIHCPELSDAVDEATGGDPGIVNCGTGNSADRDQNLQFR
jgi:hypothetical protein